MQADDARMSEETRERADSNAERRFPCDQCGAQLAFKPGAELLACPYCGAEDPIAASEEAILELDFNQHLEEAVADADRVECTLVKCDACAAEFERPEHVTALECPFCGSNIVLKTHTRRLLQPRSLLPFKIPREAARDSFRTWIRSLWFAPNALKRYAKIDQKLSGIYLPFWTYDTYATTQYSGQRGDDYWVTQTYTTQENGRTVTRTRQVRKTRWTWVSGTVHNDFDDVLVCASRSLPEKYVTRLEPWDLAELVPYTEAYLSGFRAEQYQISLDEGFGIAQRIMEPTIRSTICGDIGGDHQRIHEMRSTYQNTTFKHLLLPVWVSAYRYRAKVYRFLVNARTGEVQGERPWSWIKITLAVLAGLIVVGAAAYFIMQMQ